MITTGTPAAIGTLIPAVLAELKEPVPRISTGIHDLDTLLAGGFSPGEVTTVAGWPGTGTSMLTLGFARHAAISLGLPVLLTAPDMSGENLALRILAAEASVPLQILRSRNLTPGDYGHRQRDSGHLPPRLPDGRHEPWAALARPEPRRLRPAGDPRRVHPPHHPPGDPGPDPPGPPRRARRHRPPAAPTGAAHAPVMAIRTRRGIARPR